MNQSYVYANWAVTHWCYPFDIIFISVSEEECELSFLLPHQVQRRRLLSLPKVLSLNCQVEKTADKEFWRRQQKLSQANCRYACISLKAELWL